MKKILIGLSLCMLMSHSFAQQPPIEEEAYQRVEVALKNYTSNMLVQMQKDNALLEKKCGKGFVTVEEKNNFNNCFQKYKSQLSSNVLRASTELALVFSNPPEKREEIKQNFLDVYNEELKNYLLILASENVPPKTLIPYFNELFVKQVQDAYQINLLLSNNDETLLKEINAYFYGVIMDMKIF